MGIRMTQYQGLSSNAIEFLELQKTKKIGFRKIIETFFDKREEEKEEDIIVPITTQESSEEITTGMFGEEIILYKYTKEDGSIYFEYVQASPWFSGPMIFIALKDEKGNIVKESLWLEETINEF